MTRHSFHPLACALLLLASGCGGATPPATAPSAESGSATGAERAMSTVRPTGEDAARLVSAIEDIDQGKLAAAAGTLEKLLERLPDNAFVLHELALSYRLMKEPAKAIALLDPYRASLSSETLASLGSALDEAGRTHDAVVLLRDGVRRFPQSGLLHSELATTLRVHGHNEEAMGLYEHAIAVDPAFAPPHYHLALMLSRTPSWGSTLIHAETFRLLEPGTARSHEMARLMMNVCNDAVRIEPGAKGPSAKIAVTPSAGAPGGGLSPVSAFELTFGLPLSLAKVDGLRLATLHRARKSFVEQLRDPKHPLDVRAIPLFRWLAELDAAGHLEAYDYWLYGPALPDELEVWVGRHEAQIRAMAGYLSEHPPPTEPG